MATVQLKFHDQFFSNVTVLAIKPVPQPAKSSQLQSLNSRYRSDQCCAWHACPGTETNSNINVPNHGITHFDRYRQDHDHDHDQIYR